MWYVNVHSVAHPPGEIRGQIMPGPLDDPIPPPIAAGPLHVQLQTVADGLTAPNWGTGVAGLDDTLFVTDQPGVLWAIDLTDGSRRAFLDTASLLVDLGIFGPDSFDERGLLGVAFHPGYLDNGKLYTYTSEPAAKRADFSTIPAGGEANHQSVIRAWTVPDPLAPDAVVDPATTRELMRIDQPQFNHNAGALAFGPDGMLYIALGDGGGADDQDGQVSLGAAMIGHGCIGNGQDATNVLGSVLRIDPDGTDSANGQYGIPPDNPFLSPGDDRVNEIYAFGFRNPFRFSFDRETGALYVADVGQNHVEEVNIVDAGGNYGWKHREGSFSFVPNGLMTGYATDRDLAEPPDLLAPFAEYDHDEGIAIVGGFVYRGSKIVPLQGVYVFGDFALTFSNDGRLFHVADDGVIREFNLVGQADFGLSLLGFGEDARGEVYVLANATGTPFGATGVVLRLATKPGDFDATGSVDFVDLITLLAAWGVCDGCPPDIDMDGSVGFTDLLTLLANWG
ncbi:MAG: CHRD domain-containing protein [Phycisphaerales bacterium]|nr:PQQ-dependent sugar dehydrogenase [Phycisphaerae bacterium]NNF42502.1 CHRD domain-containing protein [Phycisphaerales bacterium]NNM25185.1 CHRD domain-containing protein [Phycisphaerales bacterium]